MAAPTPAEVERILSGMDLAEAAADYVEDQICEMQLIGGENYNMVWDVPGDGKFPPAQ